MENNQGTSLHFLKFIFYKILERQGFFNQSAFLPAELILVPST